MICRNMIDGRCSLGLHGGIPSPGVCASCSEYRGCARGLGDTIHSIAAFTGIASVVETIAGKDCGCEQRRAAMNAAVPFTDRSKES
jgi:hypothetical protein